MTFESLLICLALPRGLIHSLREFTPAGRTTCVQIDYESICRTLGFSSAWHWLIFKKKARMKRAFLNIGTPYRIRTGVTAVRGRRPEPLDEGSKVVHLLCPALAGAAIIRRQI